MNTEQKKRIINFLMVSLMAIVIIIISTKNTQANEGDVWITPTVQSVKPSTNFDIEVHVDTGGKNLGGFNMYLDFDASKLTIDTTQGTNGIDKGNDTSNYTIDSNTTDITNGHLRFAGITASGYANGSNVHIITIHAKTTSGFTSGNSNLSLRVNELFDELGNPLATTGTITGETVAALAPVYRFWSDTKQGHFYTISEAEKNHVIATYPPSVWNYERIAFYAETSATSTNSPVYRFWSDTKQHHFYTISEAEKNHVIATYPPSVWNYERIAFYAVK